MKPKLDTWGVVLAGHWNRMIFTPEWVGERLFHQEEIDTQIALLPIFPVLYKHAQVVVEASAIRIVFRPRFATTKSIGMAEQMAATTLTDLPNTPLLGVGINFSFVEANPPHGLLDLFNLKDARPLARTPWEPAETKIVRKLTSDSGVMNLTLEYNGAAVAIDVNFHTETPGKTQAANAIALEAVNGRAAGLYTTALDFLRDVYQLTNEEGGDDE